MGAPIFAEVSFVIVAFVYLFLSFVRDQKRIAQLLSYITLGILVSLFLYFIGDLERFIGNIGGFFNVTKLVMSSKLLILFVSIVLLSLVGGTFFWKDYLFARAEFFVIFLFMLAGSFLMIEAFDFLSLYLAMELQALSLYVLLAFKKDDPAAIEAAVKYFVLSSVASGVFLYGVSFIYGVVGDTNFLLVYEALNSILSVEGSEKTIIYIGMALVLSGLVFKISLVPFHMWPPDIYQGAPIWVVTLLATVSKIVGVTVIINLLTGPFKALSDQWELFFLVLGLLSIAIGSLSALAQNNLLRFLGFSTIAHMGFISLSMAGGDYMGLEKAYVYLIIYVVMILGFFSLLMEGKYRLKYIGKKLENLDDFAGFSKIAPGMSFMLALFLFSLAGIPPLAGFFAKLYVVIVLVRENLTVYAVLALLFSILGAFYYLRLIKFMYFDEPKDKNFTCLEFDFKTFIFFRVPSLLCMLFIIFYAIWPNRLINFVTFIFE